MFKQQAFSRRFVWLNLGLSFFFQFHLFLMALVSSISSQLYAQPTPDYAQLRHRMVKEELEGQGIKNARVLQAFRDTPRHEFVALKDRPKAYFDMSLPIGDSQTISAPFVVAYMTEQLDPQPTDKVLEIGTGSGYQASILSPLAREVYSIEIVEQLGKNARKTLDRLKIKNVTTKIGDGYQGWPENAPFDKIIVTCSPEKVPQPLVDQLKEGGRMIIPVGERYQQVIYMMEKKDGKLEKAILRPTLFVPMTGKAEDQREVKPDPANPKLANPSFELLAGESKEPVAWYYQRQMTVISDEKSPDGKNFVRLTNSTPGREAHIMQGLALDEKSVHAVELSVMVRGKNIAPANIRQENFPQMIIVYFDEKRARIGNPWLGPFRGTFDWQKVSAKFAVPQNTHEAIVIFDMNGATGEIDFDLAELRAIDVKELKKN